MPPPCPLILPLFPHPSIIEAYYNNVRRDRAMSGPTYDEARQDFKAYERTRNQRYGHLG